MKLTTVPDKLKSLAKLAFPGYRGRKYRLEYREKLTTASYWSGGSRDTYCLIDLATRRPTPIAGINPIGFQGPTPTTQISPGQVLVEHTIFCGKDIGITFYLNPADKHLFQEAA
jgi:hypothetical protein